MPIWFSTVFSESAEVKCFPNPLTDNELTIEFNQNLPNENTVIQLYNSLGQLIFQTPFQAPRQVLNLSDLPDGSYFLKGLQSGEVIFSEAIIRIAGKNWCC